MVGVELQEVPAVSQVIPSFLQAVQSLLQFSEQLMIASRHWDWGWADLTRVCSTCESTRSQNNAPPHNDCYVTWFQDAM